MTKKEAALGVLAVAAAAAVGYSLTTSARVIIIKDGTVDLLTFGSSLSEESPPPGRGRKYKWSAKGDKVAVWNCETQQAPPPQSFGAVTIATVEGSGTSATDLEIRNEGGAFRKLKIQLAKSGFSIDGTAPGYRLKKGTSDDLHILRVTVDSGTPTNFDTNGDGKIDDQDDGYGCVAFVEN